MNLRIASLLLQIQFLIMQKCSTIINSMYNIVRNVNKLVNNNNLNLIQHIVFKITENKLFGELFLSMYLKMTRLSSVDL